jgi:hypothetical protein
MVVGWSDVGETTLPPAPTYGIEVSGQSCRGTDDDAGPQCAIETALAAGTRLVPRVLGKRAIRVTGGTGRVMTRILPAVGVE